MRALLAAALLFLPSLVPACTSCARGTGRWGQLLVAAMALFPFAVAGVVAVVLRRVARAWAADTDPEADR